MKIDDFTKLPEVVKDVIQQEWLANEMVSDSALSPERIEHIMICEECQKELAKRFRVYIETEIDNVAYFMMPMPSRETIAKRLMN